MSRLNRYTPSGRQALTNARAEALRLCHTTLNTEHLLLGILKTGDSIIECVFSRLQVGIPHLCESIEFVIGHGKKALLGEPALIASTKAALQRAEAEAAEMGERLISIEHLLLGIFSDGEGIAVGILENFGVHHDAIREQLNSLLHDGRDSAMCTAQYQARYNQTPTLNAVSRDLTAAAMEGRLDPLFGREAELERTMQILSRRSKNNPVLIGPAGVGKTAIAEGLAHRIIAGQVPENLLNHRVVSLDVGFLTVGTRFRGDFEDRLKQIMQEVIAAKDIIIVVDELHALLGSGVAEGSIDAANLFKPMLARGEFRCIGATTLEDYRKTIEADPALERRFQPVLVSETNDAQTLEILRGLRSHYADYHQATISDEALQAAVQMSSRYIHNRFQPDKAIDLIDEAAARLCVHRAVAPDAVRDLRERIVTTQRSKDYAINHGDFPAALKLRNEENHLRAELHELERRWRISYDQERPVLTGQHIAEIVALWTGVPVAQIAADEAGRLLNLEDELHERVIGQHEAVQAVARAVRRARTDLRDRRRPIGSFLFVGPTGVGKTELARALAVSLFGDESALLKLDMSEFMENHTASRLTGSPPGYVGYEESGQLTEAVHRRPYSIVLFDEIEKAHPKVFDLLLQILDDGRLTDAQGRVVDFKNTIIIITSNAGTAHQQPGSMAFTSGRVTAQQRQLIQHEQMRAQVSVALKDLFRPELLNRIDEIVLFHSLEHEHLHEIVNLMVAGTRERLSAQSIDLQVTEEARALLVEHGYDPTYGARPLRRTVQRLLDDLLAEAILRGELASGDPVAVDRNGEELVLRVGSVVEVGVVGGKCVAA